MSFFRNAFYNAYSRRVFLWDEGKGKNVNTRDKGIGDVSYTRQNALYNDHCSRDFRRKDQRTAGGCAHIYFCANIFSAATRKPCDTHKQNRLHPNCIAVFSGLAAKIDIPKFALRAFQSIQEQTLVSAQLVCSRIVCDKNCISHVRVVKTSVITS